MTGAVPKLWPGATVTILAGGPSLRTQDLSQLNVPAGNVKIITVNDSWRLLQDFNVRTSKPFLCRQCNGTGFGDYDLTDSGSGRRVDCGMCKGVVMLSSCASYFCDAKWWQSSMASNKRSKDNVHSFHDAIYKLWWFSGSPDFADHPQVTSLKLTGQTGFESDPAGLRHGSNSGYQAINLAVHLGAKKIILLGYDMRVDAGRSHWHDEPRQTDFADVMARSMLPHFKTLVAPLRKLDIEVVNATPGSALECFPKATLEDALR